MLLLLGGSPFRRRRMTGSREPALAVGATDGHLHKPRSMVCSLRGWCASVPKCYRRCLAEMPCCRIVCRGGGGMGGRRKIASLPVGSGGSLGRWRAMNEELLDCW